MDHDEHSDPDAAGNDTIGEDLRDPETVVREMAEAMAACPDNGPSVPAVAADEDGEAAVAPVLGLLGRLLAADLDDETGRRKYLAGTAVAWRATGDDEDLPPPPTLDQLQIARAICRSLEAAIMAGDHAAIWRVVDRAAVELRSSAEIQKQACVDIVARVLNDRDFYRGYLDDDKKPPAPGAPARVTALMARWIFAARKRLVAIDGRFAELKRHDLEDALRNPRIGAKGLVAKLVLFCGAFDAEQMPHESTADAIKRIKRHL